MSRQKISLTIEPPPLPVLVSHPDKWIEKNDSKTGNTFYVDPHTNEARWEKPTAQEHATSTAAATCEEGKNHFFKAMEDSIRRKLRRGQLSCDFDHDASPVSASSSDLDSSRSILTSGASSSSVSNGADDKDNAMTNPVIISVKSSNDKPSRPVLGRRNSTDDLPVITLSRKLSRSTLTDSSSSALPKKPSSARNAFKVRTLSSDDTFLDDIRSKYSKDALAAARSSRRLSAMPQQPKAAQPRLPAESPSRGDLRGRRRSNTTSTIFINSTMAVPDRDATLQCVSIVLRAHLLEARENNQEPDPSFSVFDLEQNPTPSSYFRIPSILQINSFIRDIFIRAQMEAECIIMTLVYIEKLLKAGNGKLVLTPKNWKPIVFAGMLMASKVWDDMSMWNSDFSKICPSFNLKRVNELEVAFLSTLQFNVKVLASTYAKYYFHLRSMCATLGLRSDSHMGLDTSPLDIAQAQKLALMTEEANASLPLPPPTRRRSTTVSRMELIPQSSDDDGLVRSDAAPDSALMTGDSTRRPTLSVEQIIYQHSIPEHRQSP